MTFRLLLQYNWDTQKMLEITERSSDDLLKKFGLVPENIQTSEPS